MSLTKEWLSRIKQWEKALWESCYQPLATLELYGFITRDHLTSQQARRHKFIPMPSGTAWGSKWEYGWFKCEFTLPENTDGQRIVLSMNPAERSPDPGECLVWINGQIAGSYGWASHEITLTKYARPGEHYSILVEAYAGHGSLVFGGGPNRYGVKTVPEPGPTQVVVGESTYGVWREQVYQLALDFTTLFELRNRLDPLSLRVSETDQGLMDATLLIDLELPDPEMLETVQQGREKLRPLLECVNGSTAPTFYAFGHAHIDVAWLWPWVETERKIARTAINQLKLMEEYPDYRFLQSQPHLYTMLKTRYPKLYERFKQAVKTGNIIADGAMWVEADTNLSSGESLIRQIIYGRKFFKEEFGIDSQVVWLPDVFGYSGALPQIFRGCGCTGFATAKITWTYNGGDPFPYNTFLWEGIDGTTIPAHIFSDYNSHTRPNHLFDRWETRLQQHGIRSMMLPFGWGDGGGGPSRDHLEFLHRAIDLEGSPRLKLSSPAEFFADLNQQGLPTERYVGELYFQAHRGTYTSQAKTKQGNRRSEFALREAEFWGCVARTLNGFDFSPIYLKDTWQKLLLNQFHDVLPGSSIHRVYEEAEASFSQIIQVADGIARTAVKSLLSSADAVTIFNSLSWQRKAIIELPQGSFQVTVPACGWRTIQNIRPELITPASDGAPISADTQMVAAISPDSLENEYLRLSFNSQGELVRMVDKETNREIMTGPGNRFCLYKDVPGSWDAWDIDSMAEQQPVPTDEPVTMQVIPGNPFVAKIKLTRKLHRSTLTQIISLRQGSRRIEFDTTVDWQESHKLLKVAFPVNIHANEAIHEIQFGHLRRPNHRSRPFDADRFEVCNYKWSALAEENCGVAILNDCKYGISVSGNSLNLTLLKSSLAPDATADKGVQTFTYALYVWNGSFAESNVVREAYELNCPLMVLPGSAGEASLFNLDASNIILETVKPAEDGSTDIILRMYESKRMSTRCTLITTLPVVKATQTDMLENIQQQLSLSEGKVTLDFRPFEVKTIRLSISV